MSFEQHNVKVFKSEFKGIAQPQTQHSDLFVSKTNIMSVLAARVNTYLLD